MNKALVDSSVNIIVRTLNEEDWIRSCLTRILQQDYENKTITVVDSGSTDATRKIVEEFEQVDLIDIEGKYFPGKAINLGIANAPTDYAMILSAHCLPVKDDLISTYVNFLDSNSAICGVYGRQLPLESTHPDDARDLYMTFGTELKVQEKDYMFHNANSMIRVSAWNKIPMKEDAEHIEDRLWAKDAIEMGYKIAYLPEASVFHEHGIHQHGRNKSFRAKGVLKIIEEMEDEKIDYNFEEIHGRKPNSPIVFLVHPSLNNDSSIARRVEEAIAILPAETIYILSNNKDISGLCKNNVFFIKRTQELIEDDISLRELMRVLLNKIENDSGTVPDALSFIDFRYTYLNLELYIPIRDTLFRNFYKSVLPAWRDNGNYWLREDDRYTNINSSFKIKEEKPTIYRTVLGQGGCIRASEIRKGDENIQVDELIYVDDIAIVQRAYK